MRRGGGVQSQCLCSKVGSVSHYLLLALVVVLLRQHVLVPLAVTHGRVCPHVHHGTLILGVVVEVLSVRVR